MAKVTISTDYDLAAIAAAAGGDPKKALYDHGVYIVPDVTQATLDTAVANFDMAAYNKRVAALEVTHARAAAYPSIGDQLDALFHHGAFPDDMAATLQAVKTSHPKPAED